MKKKAVALFLTAVLLLGCAIGGTVAWLMDVTTEVKNTFTVGNIDIELNETTGKEYKMVPGNPISKDPKVTVEAGSEDCWLFVEITESANLRNFIDYEVADGWEPLPGVEGVYYRKVEASDADQGFDVIKDKTVTVLGTVTKEMMDEIEKDSTKKPTLTFKAYAIQRDENFTTEAAAWAKIQNPDA